MSPIPPVDRSVLVSWDPETAFRRFALDFGTWWPSHSHSIGGSRVKRVVLEARADGLIFEEHVDGRRFRGHLRRRQLAGGVDAVGQHHHRAARERARCHALGSRGNCVM